MNSVMRSDLSIKFDKCWVDDCSDDDLDDNEGEGVREGLLPLLGVSLLSMILFAISSVDSLLSSGSGQLLQLLILTSDVRRRIILDNDFLCDGFE